MMENIKLYTSILIAFLSFNTIQAQHIVPLSPRNQMTIEDLEDLEEEDTYFKDTNGLLNKFLGTWKTSANGKNYEFKIEKYTDNDFEYKVDRLVMRYKISSSTNAVIKSTLGLPLSNTLVIIGTFLESTNVYKLYYIGDDSDCGQLGVIVIDRLSSGKLELFLFPENVMIDTENECPNGGATHILPRETIELTKQ